MQQLRTWILRSGVRSLLISAVLLGAMATQTLTAFAVTGPQGACGNLITVDNTAGASASCDMGISTSLNSGALSYINDANATTASSVNFGTNTFSFGTTITDFRNIDAGWRLEAESAGLTNTFNSVTTTVPLSITSSTASCTPTGGQATCVTPTGHAITLNSTSSQYFLTTGVPSSWSNHHFRHLSGNDTGCVYIL